jgi:ribosomal protein S12 methylthiotransferase accessory factor
MNAYWFRDNGEVEYHTIPSCDSDDFVTDIQRMIDALKKRGLDRVIVIDLTRDEIGIPVVRVVVPGLESFAMDSDRRGDRVRYAQDHGLSRAKS